jgi:hypothetical protein
MLPGNFFLLNSPQPIGPLKISSPISFFEITTLGEDLERTPGHLVWTFWTIIFYDAKKFKSGSSLF